MLVVDPCLETLPVAGGEINTVMLAGRFLTDQIDLSIEFGDGNWPFVDSLDSDESLSAPGSLKCGQIEYAVLDDTFTESDYVSFNPSNSNKLMMAPELTNPAKPGTYTLYLRAKMTNYPDRHIDIPFMVNVIECAPMIDSSLVKAAMKDVSYNWGSTQKTYETSVEL